MPLHGPFKHLRLIACAFTNVRTILEISGMKSFKHLLDFVLNEICVEYVILTAVIQ